MKIVLIITDYGSFNNFLGDLAITLCQEKHEVSVITSKQRVIDIQDKFCYNDEGVRFFYVNFPRGFNLASHFRSSKKIRHILHDIDPDLVHIHFTTAIFTTLFVGRLKYKSLGTFHGLGFQVLNGVKKVIFGAVERFCFRRLDRICVLNDIDLHALYDLGYTNVEKYETMGLGCDLKVFDQKAFSNQQKADLREKLGIGSNDFVFAYTGRYVKFKGFDKAIQSFMALQNEHANIKLILMGGKDRIHPTGLSSELEKRLESNSNILDVGFTKDVASYLSIADVFVFPSVKEGMPVSVIEAFAMGVPVITADSRGCNEIVRDGYNGFVVDVSNDNWHFVYEKMRVLMLDDYLRGFFRRNIARERMKYDRRRYIMSERKRYGL